MKRIILPSLIALVAPCICAQSVTDALQVTQGDFKGTARFMSMGGAFTALGGDLSTLTQNPAGIAVYRRSEIGATLDINMMKSRANSGTYSMTNDQTKASCSNFGYVGVANLDGAMSTFQWGVSYGRAVSFDRIVSGYQMPTSTSLTNYVAAYTNGAKAEALQFGEDYNPYRDSGYDWLSILSFTSGLINPAPNETDQYLGLAERGTKGDADLAVHEKGYIDQYSFNFGGNFNDVVFWGLGIGVSDLNYIRATTYSESMENARLYNGNIGDAGFYLDNYKRINGTGWDVKFGLIFKPIQQLRIGAAIHSPTWYNLTQQYVGGTDYRYFDPAHPESDQNPLTGSEISDDGYYTWKLKSPWKFMVGVAGVIGNNFILSADYERRAYPDMSMKTAAYDDYGYIFDYTEKQYLKDDIKTYTQAQNTFRIGAEYRITRQLSARLGYNYTDSNISQETRDGKTEVLTSGTDPSFSLDKSTQNISCGLGYSFGAFHIDAAYVHTTRESTLMAFTNSSAGKAPSYNVKDNNNQLVFSLGFRF
ncbi:MAG: outer membrane protein transport protein [Muribaculaceae bacterium]|nr:outer membrane protein transport protein [Muribaculaceae bacterium]